MVKLTRKVPSFLLLTVLLGFPQISETIYTPSLPDIAHSLQTTDSLVELTLSVFFIGFAMGVFFWGILADLVGRRPAILAGLMVYLLGTGLCSLAPSVYHLLIFRWIQAVGSSVGSVVTQTMIRDTYEGKARNQLFSALAAPLAVSPAIGPLVGGYMDQLFGWNANFYALLIMGVCILIYCWKSLPETRPTNGSGQGVEMVVRTAKKMVGDYKIWGYTFLIGGSNGILFSYYAEAPFLFIDLLKLTAGQYGLLGIAVAAPFFFASFISHRLNKQLQGEQIILLGCGIVLAGSSILTFNAVSGWIALKWGGIALAALLMPLILLFFGIGLIISNSLSLALVDYQEARGIAGSLFGLFYYIVIACLTAIMGMIHTGTVLPLPLYFIALSLFLLGGFAMVNLPCLQNE
ncbi:multidrug effflux MFS transporter [Parachlamydia sp. AcF125]|uniref:multidrug effflux MFS transporter n=1 Tax=Parachlamydia sp. AcF125 TaxID=2795736 RepID=UPI001BC974F4|nr:multidrug effflux MFS transporter [Parachlamydia sp. AcF125]MBS4168737.1 Multidrug resistance protein D [Parachlamydia sp. AcF125]